MTVLSYAQIDILVDAIEGQCVHGVEHFVETIFNMPFEALTREDLLAIDAEVFCCDRCGWWSRTSEMFDPVDETAPSLDDQYCLECGEGVYSGC